MFSFRTIHVLPSKGVSFFVIWGEVPIIWTQNPPWIWGNPWWFHVNFPGCHGNPPTHLWEKRISIFVQWILLNHVDPMWKLLKIPNVWVTSSSLFTGKNTAIPTPKWPTNITDLLRYQPFLQAYLQGKLGWSYEPIRMSSFQTNQPTDCEGTASMA